MLSKPYWKKEQPFMDTIHPNLLGFTATERLILVDVCLFYVQ